MKYLFLLLISLNAVAGLPPTSTKGSGDSSPVTTFKIDFGNIPLTHSGANALVGIVPAIQGGTGSSTFTTPVGSINPITYYNGTGIVTDANVFDLGYDSLNNKLVASSAVIGSSTADANSILDIQSTTKAMLPPRMTTTQKNAIASPSAGMFVYDTTNTAPSYYNGATWQNLTQTLTTRSWSGYHAADCSFSVTSATYAAFSSDATCTFTQQTNLNFGTVTSALSAGNAIPGIVFTPAEIGQYRICALVGAFGATTGQGYGIEMLDNASALVASSYIQQAVGSYSEMFPLCGILNVTSTAAQTITLLGKGSAGSLTIGSVDPTIFWNINLIH